MNSVLSYGMLGIVMIFVLSGIVWGAIRGAKKTAYRLGWIVVTAIVVYLLTPTICSFGVNAILSGFNISIGGVSASSLPELISLLAMEVLGLSFVSSAMAGTFEIVTQIIALAFNSVCFVMLFWLAKVLLWPVWAIVVHCITKRKQNNLSSDGTTANVVSTKKHRRIGMLIGLVMGVFIGTLTVMPVVGMVDLIVTIDQTYMQESGESSLITQFLSDDSYDIIYGVKQGVSGTILNVMGVNAIGGFVYDGLSTAKISGEKVSLKNEVVAGTKFVVKAIEISSCNFTNITEERLDEILDLSTDAVNCLFELQSINLILDCVLSDIVAEIVQNDDFLISFSSIENSYYKQLLTGMVENVANLKSTDIKNELLTIINVAENLNDIGLVTMFINGSSLSFDSVLAKFDSQTISNVVDEFVKLNAINTVVPSFVDALISSIAEYVGVDEVVVETSSVTQAKEFFKELACCVVDVLKSLNFNSGSYVTEETITVAGGLIDTILNYQGLSEQGKLDIVNGFNSTLCDVVEGLGFIDNEELQELLDAVISNIKTINQGYQTELEYLIDFVNYVEVVSDVDTSTFSFTDLGAELDKYNQSIIIGGINDGQDCRALVMEIALSKIAVDSFDAEYQQKLQEEIDDILNLIDGGNFNSYQTLLTDLQDMLDCINTEI